MNQLQTNPPADNNVLDQNTSLVQSPPVGSSPIISDVPAETLPAWSCNTTLDEQEAKPLTVGTLFKITCSGDPLLKSPEPPVTFEFKNAEDKFSLHPLEVVQVDQTSVTLVVTSYKAGKRDATDIVAVFKDAQRINLSGLNWDTQTVLSDESPKEPYGPLGPIDISFPVWFWVGVLGPILIFLFWAVRLFKRYSQRKKLLKELETHSIAVSPYFHFNKEIRAIKRKYLDTGDAFTEGASYWQDLNSSYRMFLVRQLKVPAHVWPLNAIMKSVKKYNRKVFLECGTEIFKTLKEIEKLSDQSQLTYHDCEQLTEMVVEVANKVHDIERIKKTERKK